MCVCANFMEKCRQYTAYHINKQTVKTKVFLYSVKHNSVKMYWGVEVKFLLNRRIMRLTAGVVMQA